MIPFRFFLIAMLSIFVCFGAFSSIVAVLRLSDDSRLVLAAQASGTPSAPDAAPIPDFTADLTAAIPPTLVSLKAALTYESLKSIDEKEAAARARAWFEAAQAAGIQDRAALILVLPPVEFYMARLSDDETRQAIREIADSDTPIAAVYDRIADFIEDADDVGRRVEAITRAYWMRAPDSASRASPPHPPMKRSECVIPTRTFLRRAHQDALDVFFTEVRREGAVEYGPQIRSITDGVVVCARDDWRGGDTAVSYRSGGLSPKAGNGVIVYDPRADRYYLYFHLSSVLVGQGDIIRAGTPLGVGGNSGYNARKEGHGEHVHLELFDASKNAAVSSYKFRTFLLSLY